jgi:hypothetical protein
MNGGLKSERERISRMSISAVSSGHTASVSHEKTEGPGPDHDGDSDDSGSVKAQPQQQAATAPGTGKVVNKSA